MNRATLYDHAQAVIVARQRALLARDTIKEIEQEHRSAYNERTAANAALSEAEQIARNARLDAFYRGESDVKGLNGPIAGLSIKRFEVADYSDTDAAQWIRAQLNLGDAEVFAWLHEALGGHRKAFETIVKQRNPAWLGHKYELRAEIAGDLQRALNGEADAERMAVEGTTR